MIRMPDVLMAPWVAPHPDRKTKEKQKQQSVTVAKKQKQQ